jgi:site-specific recombinase XerD
MTETPKNPTTLPANLDPKPPRSAETADIETVSGGKRCPLAQQKLDEALAAAKSYKQKALSPNTRRSYASDWRSFEAWCLSLDVSQLPASELTVDSYLGQLAYPKLTLSVASINRRLAAIDAVHKYSGYQRPSQSDQIRLTMQGIRKEHGAKPNKKAAISVTDVKHMADLCGDQGARALRDRALLLFGFASALRRAELVALDKKNLKFSWFNQDGEFKTGFKPNEGWTLHGVDVDILNSKTDKEKKGEKIAVPANPASPYCPVQALLDWLAIEHVGDPAVFIRVSKGDTVLFKERLPAKVTLEEDNRVPEPQRLTPQSVALLLKSYAEKLELEVDDYSGHSFRRGWITAAAKQKNANLVKIAEHSRHKSMDVLKGYVDDAKKLEDHAGKDLFA